MPTIYKSTLPLPFIPTDLTIPQFFLDCHHPSRPLRTEGIPWLIDDRTGRKIGVEELRTRTYGLANAMSTRWNIGDNDVVCIFSPNHVDYPVALWAAHRLGAIVTTSNPSYTANELLHQLEMTKARLLIVHPDFLPIALAAAKQANLPESHIVLIKTPATVHPSHHHPTLDELIASGLSVPPAFTERRLSQEEGKSKLAFLSFSSGTTGKPKAVKISHYAVIANVIQSAALNAGSDRYKPGGAATGVLPLFHIYGLIVNLHFVLFCGISLVVIEKFSFIEFLKSLERHKITHLYIVPPQMVLLCKHPEVKNYDLTHIQFCMCGAAPVSGELTQQFIDLLPNCCIGQGYGMTETATTVCMVPPWQKVGTIGSAGTLMPGIEARVINSDGGDAKPGEKGELVVKGPSMAIGYLDNEKATKETFVSGWVHTGDEVVINDELEVFVVDRLKEIIKVRGFQVAPAELEGHLINHPDVSDVCVVGVPDDFSGEVPLAFIVLDESAKKRLKEKRQTNESLKIALRKHVSDHKVAYKHLADVEFVDSVPKNPSGKLLRRVLRDQARANRSPVRARL